MHVIIFLIFVSYCACVVSSYSPKRWVYVGCTQIQDFHFINKKSGNGILQSMLYLSIITALHIYNNLKSKRKYCNNGWVNTETLLLLSYDRTSVHPHSYYSHKLGSIIPCIHKTFIQYPTGLTNICTVRILPAATRLYSC